MVTFLFNLLGGHGSFWQYDDERCDRSSLRVELFSPALWGQFCASSAASAQSIASSTLSSLIRVPPPSAPHPRWPQLTPSLGPESPGGGVAWRQRLCFRRIRNIITRSLLSAGTLRERSAPGRGTEAGAGGGRGACLVENASSACLPSVVRFSEMFPRVSAVLPFRPLSRLPLCSAGPEAAAATVVPLASPHGTVRYGVSALAGPQVFTQPCAGCGTFKFNLSPACWGPCFDPQELRSRRLNSSKGKSQKDKVTCPRS